MDDKKGAKNKENIQSIVKKAVRNKNITFQFKGHQ
jgi:hypothetical protein